MKPVVNQKKNASISYGLGVAKIVAGIPIISVSLILSATLGFIFRNNNIAYYFVEIILILIIVATGLLIWSGITACGLAAVYRKISVAMEYRNREKLGALATVTGQDLTGLVRDLRKMDSYFPDAYIDMDRGEFVLVRDNSPAPMLNDGDIVLREKVRPSFAPLISVPVVFAVYATVFRFGTWYDLTAAGVVSAAVLIFWYIKKPVVRTIVEQTYKAPPPPKPVPVNTGNEALDEFLTKSVGYINELNAASLSITNEKMTLPVGELLNISRQIFAFVEKQPEKIRQIRQFMNYYLPTTIKLLSSYSELSRQPLKGDSIMEAMTKIEGSMDGIVETFRRELDGLYRDKAVDISVDIDLMLAMMRSQNAPEDFAGQAKV